MTTEQPPDETATPSNGDAAPALSGLLDPNAPLPTLTTTLPPDQVIQRLVALSKRGKLPDFAAEGADPDATERTFLMLAFGSPYDRELHGNIRRTPEGSRLTFHSRLKRKMPAIVIGAMAISLWPGVWLTDSMLSTYFSWYPRNAWITVAWYIPLTLAAIPMLWKQYTNSEKLTRAETIDTIQKIAAAIDANG